MHFPLCVHCQNSLVHLSVFLCASVNTCACVELLPVIVSWFTAALGNISLLGHVRSLTQSFVSVCSLLAKTSKRWPWRLKLLQPVPSLLWRNLRTRPKPIWKRTTRQRRSSFTPCLLQMAPPPHRQVADLHRVPMTTDLHVPLLLCLPASDWGQYSCTKQTNSCKAENCTLVYISSTPLSPSPLPCTSMHAWLAHTGCVLFQSTFISLYILTSSLSKSGETPRP